MDNRIKKHAEILVKYSLELKEGESVRISCESVCLPLALAIYEQVVEIKAFPDIHLKIPESEEILLKKGNKDQLGYYPKSSITAVKEFDAYITIIGTLNTRFLSNIDSKKQKLRIQGSKTISELYNLRIKNKEARWVGTMYPTQAFAQEANMSLAEFQEFVYSSCKINEFNPIAEWEKINKTQHQICEYLNTKSTYRIKAKDTDLVMSIKGRRWINCCGKVNFPDGEVFTGPVENTVNGYISFNQLALFQGKEIENVRLTFKDGKVVSASASKNEDFLNEILNTDAGARFVGEIAIGTNYEIKKMIKHMLFDEKIGGTIHLALGQSIPKSGGVNQSLIHWDLLLKMDEGQIFADEELIYENGIFTKELK